MVEHSPQILASEEKATTKIRYDTIGYDSIQSITIRYVKHTSMPDEAIEHNQALSTLYQRNCVRYNARTVESFNQPTAQETKNT